MRITNKHGLPNFLKEPAKEPYKFAYDYSVTDLIRPPQITRLMKVHGEDVTIDVSDQLWSLLGRAVHDRIGRRAEEEGCDTHVEKALSIELPGKIVLAGTPDLVQVTTIDGARHATIYDFKVTSVWSFVLGDKPEWEAQLRLYALLASEAYGVPPEHMTLRICAILRDWTGMRARREADYPQLPYHEVEVAGVSPTETIAYARERIAAIEGDDLCTETDRWERKTGFAVMKEGRKTAVKVCEDEATAVEMVTRLGTPHYVERRPGTWNRCDQYCPVQPFCTQHKDHVDNLMTQNLEEMGI